MQIIALLNHVDPVTVDFEQDHHNLVDPSQYLRQTWTKIPSSNKSTSSTSSSTLRRRKKEKIQQAKILQGCLRRKLTYLNNKCQPTQSKLSVPVQCGNGKTATPMLVNGGWQMQLDATAVQSNPVALQAPTSISSYGHQNNEQDYEKCPDNDLAERLGSPPPEACHHAPLSIAVCKWLKAPEPADGYDPLGTPPTMEELKQNIKSAQEVDVALMYAAHARRQKESEISHMNQQMCALQRAYNEVLKGKDAGYPSPVSSPKYAPPSPTSTESSESALSTRFHHIQPISQANSNYSLSSAQQQHQWIEHFYQNTITSSTTERTDCREPVRGDLTCNPAAVACPALF